MSEKRISDLFDIGNRFLRSAHLERDFQDPSAMSGYVVTDFARDCLGRVAQGLKPRSGQRAWRMTGDYGSGKSSFALLLANLFGGRESSLPPQLRRVVDFRELGVARPQFVPVLVTCSRQALGRSILKSLHLTLTQIYERGAKAKMAIEVQEILDRTDDPVDDEVFRLILEVNRRIILDSKGKGLLLILDELGKFLEHAALHAEGQDVFLLQRLAEEASRSGDKPLFVVALLHQGFNAYTDHLNQSAQREWEKVAARFDEIAFNQPIEQIAHLVATAINVNTAEIPRSQSQELKQTMGQTAALGWFGASSTKNLSELALRIYPLHPTVLPVLVRAFRRFGQNERSLFSFLLSNEPFGLRAFSTAPIRTGSPYRLHDLYDYVRTNFGHRLGVQSYRSHWTLIDSVIESYATDEPLQIKILKTVGILNLLNDTDLLPTEDVVICALGGTSDQSLRDEIHKAIEKLRKGKRALYDRGRAYGLCLWPHTSVDLEKAFDDARRSVSTPQRVANVIKDFLETNPIVARRHYIETGNLRHAAVQYCPVIELMDVLNQNRKDADGLIIVPLCETAAEYKVALQFAKLDDHQKQPNWLVAVPQPLNALTGLLQEVQRWDWIAANVLELNADKFAREEVLRQRASARSQLEKRIQLFIGFKQLSGPMMLEWFHQGERLKIKDGRHLLEELSRIFDDTFDRAPRIHNELANRRNLSSAAASARMRLIERMFGQPTTEFLGMNPGKKPPEMSMYLSVLKNTGLHKEYEGTWRLAEPHHRADKCNVVPSLRRIREIIQKKQDGRVNVAALFEELRQPPYGVRDGLLPLFLTVFAISNEQDIAFFKDGTFQRELTSEMMLVLSKMPERFELQYCRIEGVRADLFGKLLTVMGVKASAERKTELLDVVKPLCQFVAQLPAYALNTKKPDPNTIKVRDAILNAREPLKLLFTDLPIACGFDPIATDAPPDNAVQGFVKALKKAVDELRAVFPELQESLKAELRDAFDLPGNFRQFRATLAERAQKVVLGVTEPKLRAFCLRLLDDNLPEADWLESLGSSLALRPPAKWHDTEQDRFTQELNDLAMRFHRVESIVFSTGAAQKNAVGVRVAITQPSGTEYDQVIHVTPDEERELAALQKVFEDLLEGDNRLALAAASRALWKSFEKQRKT